MEACCVLMEEEEAEDARGRTSPEGKNISRTEKLHIEMTYFRFASPGCHCLRAGEFPSPFEHFVLKHSLQLSYFLKRKIH